MARYVYPIPAYFHPMTEKIFGERDVESHRGSNPFTKDLLRQILDIVIALMISRHCVQPKHPRHDAWDRAMDERDARLKEEYAKSQQVSLNI